MNKTKQEEYIKEGQWVTYDAKDLSRMPKREKNAHKGNCGKILVAAGSEQIFGAAYFTAAAAYRTGAGLVKVITHKENRSSLQTLLPEALIETYDREVPEEEKIKAWVSWADVIAIGPGMGMSKISEEILHSIGKHSKVPLVIDADGINLLAKSSTWFLDRSLPVILTPHLREFSRLTHKDLEQMKKNLLGEAREFIKEHPCILVCKDHETLVVDSGEEYYRNQNGNPGMATGGSGDVLTGIIASLIGQGMAPKEAARFGVFLHGAAGDWAAKEKGIYSMLASDMIKGISEVTKNEKI